MAIILSTLEKKLFICGQMTVVNLDLKSFNVAD